jgi:hypothetical protein
MKSNDWGMAGKSWMDFSFYRGWQKNDSLKAVNYPKVEPRRGKTQVRVVGGQKDGYKKFRS